jgi:hypothetical protein
MPRLERHFQKNLVEELKKLPNTWVFVPPTKSVRGIPDIILCVNGHFASLELKRVGAPKDPSREKLQIYIKDQIMRANGYSFFGVNDNNWKTIYEFLEKVAHGTK